MKFCNRTHRSWKSYPKIHTNIFKVIQINWILSRQGAGFWWNNIGSVIYFVGKSRFWESLLPAFSVVTEVSVSYLRHISDIQIWKIIIIDALEAREILLLQHLQRTILVPLPPNVYFRLRFGLVNTINTYLRLKICVVEGEDL